MAYLIDGNNLCGAGRDRRLGLPTGEHEMIRVLVAFAAARSVRLTVVFDGAAGRARASGAGRVTVVHSGAHRSADDAIAEQAASSDSPADITVVTSDRTLGVRVRDLGCRVIGCRRFAEVLRRAAAPDLDEKPRLVDVEDWERYFSGDD